MINKNEVLKKIFFKSKKEATDFQKKFKKTYGYRPSLFIKVKGKKIISRFIVKPFKLEKLN